MLSFDQTLPNLFRWKCWRRGEWAMAGTYVAEAWPEDRRKMGAGYLQTGYYFGFFVAAALNFSVGASFGWRAMFLCGLAPVVVAIATLLRVKEPDRWKRHHREEEVPGIRRNPLLEIFSRVYLMRTITMSVLLTAAIIGLWAGAVYEPTALIFLSRQAGMDPAESVRMASYGTGLPSIGTILGCLAAPWLAERIGRRSTLAVYYLGMLVTIVAAFGWAFYLPGASAPSRIHVGTVLPWSVRWQFCNLQLGSTIMETALVMASKNTRRDLRPVMRTWLGRIPATASSILKLDGGLLMLRGLSVANSCQSLNVLF
jgi:MFS family permease